AGSVIPLGSVTANALVFQRNLIDIDGGGGVNAEVEAGGNVKLYADRNPFGDMTAQGKAVNWASSLIGALDSALGGNAHSQTKGTAHQDSHAIVTVDGIVKTGANRKIDVVITDVDASGNV